MQRVGELAAALRLVADLRPGIVVEVGCMNGGTLYAWRQICAEVYGITLPLPNPDFPIRHGADVLLADSHDSASVAWLQSRLDGRPIDVLHIDGDHSYAGARADWDMYVPLVRPGGLVLLHDIANARDPGVEVSRLWREVKASGVSCHEIVSPRNPVGFGVLTIPQEGLLPWLPAATTT